VRIGQEEYGSSKQRHWEENLISTGQQLRHQRTKNDSSRSERVSLLLFHQRRCFSLLSASSRPLIHSPALRRQILKHLLETATQ